MAYQKQQWLANQTIISADRMNHIEDGIANIELTPGADGITPQLRLGDSGIEVSYDNGQQWQLLVPLSQITGPQGEPGQTVKIYKTYASVEAMNADAENVPEGSLVMIVSDVNDEDNGKIYSKGADGFVFVVDISGLQGIQGEQGVTGETGLTPVISVKAETLEAGAQATATRSGTDEAPLITFGIPRGADGAEGAPGKDGVTPDISAVAVSVPYGTPVSVEKSGTTQAPVFTFSIPEGKQGEAPDTSKYVTYSDFEYGGAQRKTIQLANYDSISGVGTDGQGYNIAMVSKWDKVDLGTPSLTTNLNSLNGEVQINDEKTVATVDQIPDVSNFATKAEIPDVSGFATKTEVTEGLAEKQAKGDYPVYQEFVAGASDKQRKTIQLANADSISGVSTSGGGANLIMMSQWDKVDIGSTQYQMNLNSPSGVVQINDEKVIATVDQIPSVENLATKTELNDGLAAKQDAGDYATTQAVSEQFTEYDASIKSYVDSKVASVYKYKGSVANVDALPTENQTVGDVYNVEDTGDNYAWTGTAWDKLAGTVDLSNYATKAELTPLATKEELAKQGVYFLGNFASGGQAESAAAVDGVYNNANYSLLVYTVNGQNGQIVNNVAETTTQYLYWQGKRYTRVISTVDGAPVVGAWASDDGYVALPNRAVMPSLFQLTTDADSDTVKAALTSSQSNEPITLADLNKCLQTGYVLRYYAMQSGSVFVGFTGQAFTLTYVGFANPTQEPALMSVCVNITEEGVYSVTRNATRGIILTSANIGTNSVVTALTDRVSAVETAVADAATKAEVQAVEEKIPDVSGFATTTALTEGLDAKAVTVGNVGLNKDTVEIKQGETTLAKLAIPYHPLKVNASLFIDDGSFYDPEAGLGGHPDYFNNTAWSGGDSLTEEQLAQAPFLLITGTNTVSGDSVTTETNLVSLGKDSALGKFYATKEELAGKADAEHTHEIADVTGLQALLDTLPVMIQIPIRTLQDKVYDQATIFGWFGVEDIAGLRGLFSSQHLLWLRYGIASMGVGHMMYRFVVEYAEVNSDGNTIKLVFSGLNTQNDKLAKYEFTAKLDGTIVEGQSNVQLVVTDKE